MGTSQLVSGFKSSVPVWRLFRDECLQDPVIEEQSYANYKWIALGEGVWISMKYRFPVELKLNGLDSVEALRGYCKVVDEAINWVSDGNYCAGSVARKASIVNDKVKFHLACQMSRYLFILGEVNKESEKLVESVRGLSELIMISDCTSLGVDKVTEVEKALRVRGSYPLLIGKELVEKVKDSIRIWDNVWIY